MVVEVEFGGKLSDHKGMNLPGTPLSIPCVTEKDLEDLKFGLSQGVDAVALSFVRNAADITFVKDRIRKHAAITRSSSLKSNAKKPSITLNPSSKFLTAFSSLVETWQSNSALSACP